MKSILKTKGFTLIELLAVIVILAVLALITVPAVQRITSSSKTNSNKISVENYAKAVGNAIVLHETENSIIPDGTYPIVSGGNICLNCISDASKIANNTVEKKIMYVDTNGKKPKSGMVRIEGGKVINISSIIFDEYVGIYRPDEDKNEVFDKNYKGVLGDVNADGKFNKQDAIDLSKYLFLDTSVSSPAKGDINSDGKINAEDINLLSIMTGTVTSTIPNGSGLMGDADGNGLIETDDVILILRYAGGNVTINDFVKLNSDVNESGTYDGLDGVTISQGVLGTLSKTVSE